MARGIRVPFFERQADSPYHAFQGTVLFFRCEPQIFVRSCEVRSPFSDPHFQFIPRHAESLFHPLMLGNVAADAEDLDCLPRLVYNRPVGPRDPHPLAGSPYIFIFV